MIFWDFDSCQAVHYYLQAVQQVAVQTYLYNQWYFWVLTAVKLRIIIYKQYKKLPNRPSFITNDILGFLTAVKLRIIPYKPYIKLTYRPTFTTNDAMRLMERETNKGGYFFLHILDEKFG